MSAAFAAGLMLCTLSVGPVTLEGASAQTLAQARKKVDRKSPAPKQAAKEQHERERTPFTVEEDDAAVIPGIPDARVWGDSETAFARLLPQASGPWLAISGGGSDGAYGAGVLTGWTQSGDLFATGVGPPPDFVQVHSGRYAASSSSAHRESTSMRCASGAFAQAAWAARRPWQVRVSSSGAGGVIL